MHYLHFTTLVLAIFRLGKTASMTIQEAENPYDYGKIIYPLAVQNMNVNLDKHFVYEGTYSITYQLDISELLSTIVTVVSELLSPEMCKRSEMLELFCDRLKRGAREIQKEVAETVVEMKTLSTTSSASGLRIAQLPVNLSSKMQANGTSRCLETIKQEEEQFSDQVKESAEFGIAEITKRGDETPKGNVMSMYSETLRILWPLQQYRVALFEDTLSKCRKYNLPLRFVNKEALENDVNELRQKLEESGFEVAVPVEKMGELALTDCSVTSDHLLKVTVNVPLRQSGNWSFQSVKPIPFMFNEERCTIYQDETVNGTSVAAVNSKYMIIRELDYDKVVGGIYVVPQNESQTLQNYSCLFALLNNHSISKIKYACPFSCTTNASSVSITPIGRSKYVVSGGNYINMSCEAGEKYLSFPDYGSLEVDMSICKCQITFYGSNDTIILNSPRRSCDQQRVGFPEMVHVIPSQWTNLLAINYQQRLNSLKEIFNTNWGETWLNKSEEERLEAFMKEIAKVPEQTPVKAPWYQWGISLIGIILAMLFFTFGIPSILWGISAAVARSRRHQFVFKSEIVN